MTATMTKKQQKKKKKQQPLKKGWKTAAKSDIHDLYEQSVQDPEAECELIDQVWKELRGRKCVQVREDFCGTAAMSAAWVKHRAGNTAVGVDLDTEVLAWAKNKLETRLDDDQRKRISLIEGDVRSTPTQPVDSVCAMNFSYYLFKTRQELREYFKVARSHLVDDGMFLLDAYGGSEAFEEMEEERDLDGFTYVWDQHYYDPITGDATNYIHFRFPDGTKIKKAFEYHWRLWTLPEIKETLLEAGFSEVVIYWEGTDEDGEGNGEFTRTEHGEACEGWVAYLVAKK